MYLLFTGKKIAEIRRKQRLTQEALAHDVSLTRTSIVNIEKGKQQLLLHTLIQIAHALKTEPAELLPEIVLFEQPASAALSRFVEDPKGRAWIETSLRKYGVS